MQAPVGAPRMEFLSAVVLFSALPAIGFADIVHFAQLLAARLGLPPANGAGSDHNTQDLADYPESPTLASSTHRPTPLCHAACLRNSATGYGFSWQRIRTTLPKSAGNPGSPRRQSAGRVEHRKRRGALHQACPVHTWAATSHHTCEVPPARLERAHTASEAAALSA